MAHTPETLSTGTDMMKDDYAASIMQTTAERSFLFSHLERVAGKVAYGGKAFIIPLLFDSMGSFGSQAEGDDLPDSMPINDTTTSISVAHHYFSVAVSGPAMAMSEKDSHAFSNIWGVQIAVKSRSFRQHINRQFNGDGNGYLCQVDGSTSGVYVTVDNAFGLSGFRGSPVNGAKFLTPNMKVDFISSGTVRDSGGVTISAISTQPAWPSTSAVLTTSGTISSVADGDYVVLTNTYGHEMDGMMTLIDDGTRASTFQSVVVATYPEFASHVQYGSTSGTAEAITRLRMETLADDIEVDGGNIDFWYTSNGVWITIGEAMASGQQLVSYDTIKGALDTGWRAIMFNGIPVYKDPYCIDELYAIDTRCVKIHQVKDPGWLVLDGDVIKQTTKKDQWEAYWAWYAAPAMHNRKWCGKIADISVTANKM